MRMVGAALMLLVAMATAAAEAQSRHSDGALTAADRRGMELQEAASKEDLWMNGDHWRDPREWKRTWNITRRGWPESLDADDIAWGREKRPVKSRIIVLDPPLPKTIGPDKVQVEWFASPLDEAGTNIVWRSSIVYVLGFWYHKWPRDERKIPTVPAEVQMRLVGKGPNLLRRYNPQRRLFQELVYGWENLPDVQSSASDVMRQLILAGDEIARMTSRASGEIPIEKAGASVEEWRSRVDGEVTRARIEEADTRYREMMRRAVKVNAKAMKAPQDPVLLIDGKYLLTGPVTGKIRDLFRMANRIIRERTEAMPMHGFNWGDVRWGNERRPKRGELTELSEPFASGEGTVVEWMHTYIDRDGAAKPVQWHEAVRDAWMESLNDAGIRDVRFASVPLVNARGAARAHQRVHQEAALSWGPEQPLRRRFIHSALAEHLYRAPLSLGSHEAVGAMLKERRNIDPVIYDASRTSARRPPELAEARAKGRAVQRVLARKRRVHDPVFLVNGTYVIATGSVTDAYQVLNWLVRRIQEQG